MYMLRPKPLQRVLRLHYQFQRVYPSRDINTTWLLVLKIVWKVLSTCIYRIHVLVHQIISQSVAGIIQLKISVLSRLVPNNQNKVSARARRIDSTRSTYSLICLVFDWIVEWKYLETYRWQLKNATQEKVRWDASFSRVYFRVLVKRVGMSVSCFIMLYTDGFLNGNYIECTKKLSSLHLRNSFLNASQAALKKTLCVKVFIWCVDAKIYTSN